MTSVDKKVFNKIFPILFIVTISKQTKCTTVGGLK